MAVLTLMSSLRIHTSFIGYRDDRRHELGRLDRVGRHTAVVLGPLRVVQPGQLAVAQAQVAVLERVDVGVRDRAVGDRARVQERVQLVPLGVVLRTALQVGQLGQLQDHDDRDGEAEALLVAEVDVLPDVVRPKQGERQRDGQQLREQPDEARHQGQRRRDDRGEDHGDAHDGEAQRRRHEVDEGFEHGGSFQGGLVRFPGRDKNT